MAALIPLCASILPRIRGRRFAAGPSCAVLIEIALSLLPFWPNGLLPQDVTTYLVGRTLAVLGR